MKTPLIIALLLILLLILTCCLKKDARQKADSIKLPEWADGYPLYEVYIRDFTPEGTFKALEAKLPELKEYGISNIWLMPIHPIGEIGRKGSLGCPYSVKDYFAVNPEYGSMEDFDEMIAAAHKLEMKVIIDMVMNHCSNDYVEMPHHPEWFAQDSAGRFTREVADWSDVTDWNFDNPQTSVYLDSVLTFWVRDHKLDGFRCDVAGMIPDQFWQNTIPKLQKINPEIYMLAEWETPNMYTVGFHSTYDWTLYHTMKAHLEGKANIDELWNAVTRIDTVYPAGAMPLRFIENHDQERAVKVFGEEDFQLYGVLIFTLPGIPLLYNGQEAGDTLKPSLFEKETIEWNDKIPGIRQFYQKLAGLRNSEEILRKGNLSRVDIPGEDVLGYLRTLDKKSVLTLMNFSDEEQYLKLPDDIFIKTYTWNVLFASPSSENKTIDTQQTIVMPPKSSYILKSFEGK